MYNLTDHPLWPYDDEENDFDWADQYDLMASEYKEERYERDNDNETRLQ